MHQPLNELLVCPKYFGWFWVQCGLPLGCRVVNMSSLFLMNSTWFAFKLLNQFTSFKFFTYVAKTFASLNPHREEDRGIAINHCLTHCTEVHFVSFFSGEFITAIVVNPPERKRAKRISVQCFFLLSYSWLLSIAAQGRKLVHEKKLLWKYLVSEEYVKNMAFFI